MNEMTAKATFIFILLSVPPKTLQDKNGIFHREFYPRMEQALATFCPKVDICDRNKTESTVSPNGLLDGSTTRASCCKGCSCHERCHENLNCCFQTENTTTYTTKGCMYVQTKIVKGDIPAYRIVSSAPTGGCKPDSNCPELKKRGLTGTCESGQKLRPWGDLFPVYSTEEDEIYKNELCACCHGVGNYVPMHAYLICDVDVDTLNSFAKHISSLENGFNESHCYVTFRYHDSAVVESKRCYIGTTSTCQSTTTFTVPLSFNLTTAEVVEACEKGPESPFSRHGRYYKNVFCGICNSFRMEKPLTCPKINHLRSFIVNKFTFVFSLNSIYYQAKRLIDEGVQKVTYPQACRNANEGPKMLGRCRVVFCPSGQLRRRLGHCIFTSTTWYKDGFAVFVKLQYMSKESDINTNMLEENITASDILDSLQESTPWPKRWSIINIYQDVSGLHVERYLFVFLGCRTKSPVVLYRDVVRSLGQSWEFVLNGIAYIANQSILQYSSFDQPKGGFLHSMWSLDLAKTESNMTLSTSHGYYLMKAVHFKAVHVRRIVLPKLFVCDQVALQSEEYLLVANNRILVSNLTTRVLFEDEFELVPNGTETMTARVCQEDSVFKTRKATGNSSEFAKAKSSLILLIVTTLFVLGL